MSTSRYLPLTTKSFVAVVLVVVCVMFMMAWANVAFRESAFSKDNVFYASRIAGLPIISFLVWLLVREHRSFLRRLFSFEGVTVRIVLTSIVVAVLARLFWWSQIIARASLGWLETASTTPPAALSIVFSCPELPTLLMAVVVWWFLVPFTEEFVHRGVLMSALSDKGPVFAVAISALIFAAMHRPESYLFVFLFGVVFGSLYWNARTLWAPIIVHATYDGIIVLDWYCLKTSWNPPPEDLPNHALGLSAGLVATVCAAGIAFLVTRRWVGPQQQPNPISA